ncbi:hypothetical protein CAPTEDRAFT_226509 [Capitella teleta]|uniref:U3 small nucleolar RNA-associated protein 6 homolog C-terminal domain-containing protein n=1 Tax=Capitella teleta TaxID=283909 RepID=R7TAN9_CAPTE|nr:hypothetical protein CAPTEDRAFT_226509 [Capitella teleta]|eukprot:ELT90567.1 hypothetical protein CAPTEDRAFT_226509 [Capitella teleta]
MVEEKAAAKKLRPRRIEAAHSTFRAALAHNAVTEESASFWIKLAQLTRDSSYLLTLTSDLVNGDFKRNVSIWRERLLQVATSEIDDEDEKTRMCEAEMDRALSLVPAKESLPLWNFALEWNVINQPMDKVQALFEKSVTQTPEVAGPCKTAYLKWASLHLDVKAVRKIFKKLSVSQPLSVEFFRTYVDIENSQVNPSMKRIHAAFDSAVSYFGSTDTDLWMDYLRLASLHPMGCPEKVGQIYFKAKNQLDDQHIERFIAQYTLFQAGHSATS